jgi:hypothetical protein
MESARPDAREAAERASSARRRICHRRLALEAPRAGADDCGGGGDGEGEEDPMGRVPEMSASVIFSSGSADTTHGKRAVLFRLDRATCTWFG